MTVIASLLAVYLVFVGLVVGSFINLAADRVPRRESVIRPRSHCRACGRVLNTIDLLPVLGYLVRRGRCATCGSPIGLSAPIVEGVAGVCMAVPLIWLGAWPGAFVGLCLVAGWGLAVTGRAVRRFATDERAPAG
jgi:leader peptidase (prepilin peptidase) / N-methyltransferase